MMKQLNLSPSIFANVMNTSAKPALVIHIFVPFRMYSFPSGDSTAVVFAARASEPEFGSVKA